MRKAEIALAIGIPPARYEDLPKSDKTVLESWQEAGK